MVRSFLCALSGSQIKRTGRLLYKSNSDSLPGIAGGLPIGLLRGYWSADAMETGIGGEDGSVAEVAEAFAGLALEGVAFDDGTEHFDGAVDRGAG